MVGLAIIGLILFAILIFQPDSAFADAGGFPTSTPTITPTGTPTIPPTQAPTATFTALPTITLVNLLDVQVTSEVSSNVATGIEPQSGTSIFTCWPLAIVFLLVGVVIAAYLLTRRAKLEVQE